MKSDKVIAQVCSSPSWGGMEMHVSVLSEQLAKRGYSPVIFCDPGSPLCRNIKERGLGYFPFRPGGYVAPWSVWQAAQAFKKLNVKLLHVHYSRDLWTTAPAARLAGKLPTVFVKHIGTQKPKLDPVHKAIYRTVNHVIAISQVIGKNLAETHPVDPERISVIHHGVDLATFAVSLEQRQATRQSLGVSPDELLIGTVGRLQVGKGHLEFIEMAAALSRKYPKVRFVIVGEATKGEEEKADVILKKAGQMKLGDRLIFSGFRRDIEHVLAALDIFAFPSHAEAFGLVVIEAMAARCPVVSSRCDGILDIVEHNYSGLLVNPQNTDELTAAVDKLIMDPRFRARLAENGYNRVKEYFTIDKMVDRVESIYQQCLL